MTTLGKIHTVFMLAAGAACLGGCGQADYEQRMEKTKARVEQAGKFSPLSLFPIEIADTPFKIRLPGVFTTRAAIRFFAAAADGNGGPSLDDLRPPMLRMPHLKLVIQTAAADDRGSQYPYFCYIAALPPGTTFTVPVDKPAKVEPKTDAPAEPPADAAAENKPAEPAEPKNESAQKKEDKPAEDKPAEEKPMEEKPAADPAAAEQKPVDLSVWIQDELAKAFPAEKEKPEWQPVEAPTPVLGQPSIPWKRISVTGNQPFQFLGGETSDFLASVPGKFVLYMGEREGTTLLLGWRIPTALESKSPIEQWATLCAGTLQP